MRNVVCSEIFFCIELVFFFLFKSDHVILPWNQASQNSANLNTAFPEKNPVVTHSDNKSTIFLHIAKLNFDRIKHLKTKEKMINDKKNRQNIVYINNI